MEGSLGISVIVAARNAEDEVGGLLEALDRQHDPGTPHEVIVVDDASTDRTREIVARHSRARLIPLPVPVGAPRARNIGLAEAQGELIAITDSDCTPADDWLAAGAARFAADPGLDVLGGAIDVTLPETPTVPALVDAARFLDQERMVGAGFAISANMWIRADVLRSVGGFNEALRPNAQEDVELGRLLTQAGRRIEFAPEVVVRHPARGTFRDLARKGYRLGRAHPILRRHARVRGPWLRPYWLRRRVLVPHGTVSRMSRLHRRGIHPGRAQRAAMFATEVACVSLLHVTGDLVGTAAGLLDRALNRRPG
ncbi:MAG TPA: glycosyltransferase [Solirubrobacterales bacterium]|jgi:glycosyltransferase involved in cell wall biosynthesis